MKPNYRKILAKNAAALMAASRPKSSHAKAAAAIKALGYAKVGARTIGHLCNPEGPMPTLTTIVAYAEAFKVPVWQLLNPDFDAASKTVGTATMETAARLDALPQERRELLFQIMGEPVADEDNRLKGWQAPAPTAVHSGEPPAYLPPGPRVKSK